MTADVLRSNVTRRLKEQRDETLRRLRQCKPRSPILYEQGVAPATQCEEIALSAVDINATVDALDKALEIVAEEFKKLMSPEEPEQGVEAKGKELYG